MYPTLQHESRVVVLRNMFTNIKVQDVIIFLNPKNNLPIVKRVTKTKKDAVFVVGDNQEESTDSRKFGWIQKKYILGKVIGKI